MSDQMNPLKPSELEAVRAAGAAAARCEGSGIPWEMPNLNDPRLRNAYVVAFSTEAIRMTQMSS